MGTDAWMEGGGHAESNELIYVILLQLHKLMEVLNEGLLLVEYFYRVVLVLLLQ